MSATFPCPSCLKGIMVPSDHKSNWIGCDGCMKIIKIPDSVIECTKELQNQIMHNEWYYAKSEFDIGEKEEGPVEFTHLQQLVSTGDLLPDDLVWNEGMSDWVAAGTIDELSLRIGSTLAEWHYARSEFEVGENEQEPVVFTHLQQMASTGELFPDDLVRKEGMNDWVEAKTINGLSFVAPSVNAINTKKENNQNLKNYEDLFKAAGIIALVLIGLFVWYAQKKCTRAILRISPRKLLA